jgi:hypothetical protein
MAIITDHPDAHWNLTRRDALTLARQMNDGDMRLRLLTPEPGPAWTPPQPPDRPPGGWCRLHRRQNCRTCWTSEQGKPPGSPL